jgi:hypothetical protein
LPSFIPVFVKTVPGINGNQGLSTVATKSVGSIDPEADGDVEAAAVGASVGTWLRIVGLGVVAAGDEAGGADRPAAPHPVARTTMAVITASRRGAIRGTSKRRG